MGKYIIKESELCSVIHDIITEELTNRLNEGFWKTLGKVATTAAVGAVAPTYLVQRAANKASGVINRGETLFKRGGTSSSGGNGSRNRRLSRSERQNNRFKASRSINNEYGPPETTPGLGHRIRLDKKRDMDLPSSHNQGIDWGDFGQHYHDEGDRAWYRKILDTERSLIRVSHGDQNRQNRLQKRYKRRLLDWLKERDNSYKVYIKDYNSNC